MQLFSFPHASGAKVVVEDDGRSAYAYFIEADDQITGDVWLYNCDYTPADPEWETGNVDPPFRNAAAYVCDKTIIPVQREEDISVDFRNRDGTDLMAFIHIHGRLSAIVGRGTRPGWSANARLDGPVARRLDPGGPEGVSMGLH